MKRILMIFLAITLFTGMAFADDIGLTVGIGYIEPNTDADEDERLNAELTYEGEFGAIEVFGEIIYSHPLGDDEKGADADGTMTIELEGAYNFNDNMKGILNLFVDMPLDSDIDETIWLTPGFQYKHTFGFGDIYARIDMPLYLGSELDAMDFVGLDLTFSYGRLRDKLFMPNTWGIELALINWLTEPSDDDIFLEYLTFTPYYEHEWFYGEVEVVLPLYEDGMDFEGIHIIPYFDINILPVKGLSFWFNVPIEHIGADDTFVKDTVIGFGAGLRFSF